MKTKNSFLSILIAVSLIIPAGSASAAELSYDPYASVYDEGQNQEPSTILNGLNHLLVAPLYLVKWPVDQALLAIENHKLDKKALWIYERIQDYGVSPHANILNYNNLGGGAEVDFIRLARFKEQAPDAILKGWASWNREVQSRVGGKIGWERIADTGFNTGFIVDYENRRNEHFYGIGPDTSPGEGSVYSKETTKLRWEAGYNPYPVWNTDVFVEYKNVNISSGRDGGRGQRGEVKSFAFDTTPGIFGDSLISTGFELKHDTRNQKENSTRGGMERIGISYNEGIHNSRARYFKYMAEISHYFTLGSDRRVVAVHAYAEHNDEINGGEVPFHQMPRLGGYGIGSRRDSHTLRGYDFNRFTDESAILFNLEYRYTIWQYRDFKLDTIISFDEGQTFSELSEFKFSDFNESYGLGFRVSLANINLLSVEMSHGDEGTNFYLRSSTPF